MAKQATMVNKSIYGWNRDDTFEVVRTQSNTVRGKWWVSLRHRNRQDSRSPEWWHGRAEYTEAEAKVLFDFFCQLPEPLLRDIMEELVRIGIGLEQIG